MCLFFNIVWNFCKTLEQRSCRTYTKKNTNIIFLLWTQCIINPNYDDSSGGYKSTFGKWTIKSLKCVMAKDLLFSVISTFMVPPGIKNYWWYPYYVVAYF